MKIVINKCTLFLLLSFTGLASAEPMVIVECQGRSWKHQIKADLELQNPSYIYIQSGFSGSVVSQFETERLFGNPQEIKVLFRGIDREFAIQATSDGTPKIENGRKGYLGNGGLYRNDGLTGDIIRTCWMDATLFNN